MHRLQPKDGLYLAKLIEKTSCTDLCKKKFVSNKFDEHRVSDSFTTSAKSIFRKFGRTNWVCTIEVRGLGCRLREVTLILRLFLVQSDP